MKRATRQTFSPEFKREAVRLLESGEKETSQLARELGVRRNQLYKWKIKNNRGQTTVSAHNIEKIMNYDELQ